MPLKEYPRKEPVTKVPEGIEYDLAAIEAQTSLSDTFKEVVKQVEQALGTRVSCETLADIIASEFQSQGTPAGLTVRRWLTNERKPTVENAKAFARALGLPETYIIRFYNNE